MFHRSASRSRYVLFMLLASGVLVRCDCENTEFFPSARYMPSNVLDFGEVAVDAEKTLAIVVRNDGSAALNLLSVNEQFDADDAGKWIVEVDPELMAGLAPSQTASITVTYRPCPAAWTGDEVNQDFDFNQCDGDPDSGVLDITDNTPSEPNRKIDITGVPVQPPSATLRCPVMGGGSSMCNVPDPDLQQCNGVTFGPVTAGLTPCDVTMEIVNEWRDSKPVGTLVVENIEINVVDLNQAPEDQIRKSGADVGFVYLDESGNPLELPFEVPIPPGETMGSYKFRIRFTGAENGFWGGLVSKGHGLRVFTNDPDNRVIATNLSGQGAAANLQCFPPILDFGPVEQATTATGAFSCRNSGDAMLEVSAMALESQNPEFVIMATRGNPPFSVEPFGSFDIGLEYTPNDGGIDVETLVITSNDLRNNGRTELGVRGGAVPICNVPDTLFFALPPNTPPPLPPRTEILQVLSAGFGDCVVERVDIIEDNTSKDDFTIDLPECSGGLPCTLNETLPPMTGSFDIPIVYDNNDISTTDSVNLHVYTNDPGNPDQIVILQAQDDPCFPPMPIIEVETERPCVGMPVRVNALLSNPGGDGMNTRIVSWDWQWLFAPQQPEFVPVGMEFTTFIPQRDGIYFLGLHVVNDCGAMSQSLASEMINVSASCN